MMTSSLWLKWLLFLYPAAPRVELGDLGCPSGLSAQQRWPGHRGRCHAELSFSFKAPQRSPVKR